MNSMMKLALSAFTGGQLFATDQQGILLPSFSSAHPPHGTIGVPYSYQFVASGSPIFSLDYGSLPDGLTLSPSGLLSGTPTTQAGYTFSVRASNATGPKFTLLIDLLISLDERPRFGTGVANAWTSSPQSLIDSMTLFTGAAYDSNAGSFTVSPGAGQYGWCAFLASNAADGVTFFDGIGNGGWSGAGLAGNNTGASPDISVSSVIFTQSNGLRWRLFRQDYSNAGGSFTVS